MYFNPHLPGLVLVVVSYHKIYLEYISIHLNKVQSRRAIDWEAESGDTGSNLRGVEVAMPWGLLIIQKWSVRSAGYASGAHCGRGSCCNCSKRVRELGTS